MKLETLADAPLVSRADETGMTLLGVYRVLYQAYGPQHWWPGETPFEIMAGAVLTQNTAWTNVEKAIAQLRAAGTLDPESIAHAPHERLAGWLRPAGYFNIKARRLRNFCEWYLEQGGLSALARRETSALRHGLLSVNGIGPETADDILLYAFTRPVFVIDAYTRRIFFRMGLLDGAAGYETLRHHFENTLREENGDDAGLAPLFNEYHALIVRHGKDICRPRPRCAQCCLESFCEKRVTIDE